MLKPSRFVSFMMIYCKRVVLGGFVGFKNGLSLRYDFVASGKDGIKGFSSFAAGVAFTVGIYGDLANDTSVVLGTFSVGFSALSLT
jgi:hypothetical protein